ncbi:MAG: hypothetical protein E7567_05630 [Ruminococcaceae bacterium]|nr:hypothetical protein [Oscillospiraceae bacterium]
MATETKKAAVPIGTTVLLMAAE